MDRIEFDGADYEFIGFLVHGAGRVVGGREGDWTRYVGRDGVCVGWDCALCAE